MTDHIVGFVGLGNMGRPMASLLIGAGQTLLAYDAAPAARSAATEAGIEVAETLREVATAVDTLILMVPSSDVVEVIVDEVLQTEGRRVATVVDMSSSVPDRTVAVGSRCADNGIRLVDAPVSGGVVRAVSGELTIMVGGADEDVARVSDLLDVLGTQVIHVGGVGAGHAAKALNNLLSASHLLATNEAALAAQAFGIDPAVFLNVVNSSSGRSGSSELKLPRYVLTGRFDSGFSAALLEKDLKIALGVEHSLNIPAPVSEAVGEQWSALRARLEDGADHTEIIRPIEQDLGRDLRSGD